MLVSYSNTDTFKSFWSPVPLSLNLVSATLWDWQNKNQNTKSALCILRFCIHGFNKLDWKYLGRKSQKVPKSKTWICARIRRCADTPAVAYIQMSFYIRVLSIFWIWVSARGLGTNPLRDSYTLQVRKLLSSWLVPKCVCACWVPLSQFLIL